MPENKFSLNPVALSELKAELSRRQISVDEQKRKLESGSHCITSSRLVLKKSKKSLKPVKHNAANAEKQQVQEDLEIQKSRRTLEAKARLYEALRKTAEAGKLKYTENEAETGECLIDFERKVIDGRLPLNDESSHSYDYNPADYDSLDDDESKIAYDQLKREYHDDLDQVTYSHLRQGEIRTHGVGFYAFSQNAEERAAEQARLKELHQQSELAREKNEQLRAKKDSQMGQRLAKLRARKGLPDVATVAAKYCDQSTPPIPPLEVEEVDIGTMLRKMRDEAEERAREREQRAQPVDLREGPLPVSTTQFIGDFATSSHNRPKTTARREWDFGK